MALRPILCLLVALAAVLAMAAAQCGTCTSLGYTCITPGNPARVLDRCGQPLNASTCPVPDCGAYCQNVFGSSSGAACNDAAHLCACGQVGAQAGPAGSPVPAVLLASPSRRPLPPPAPQPQTYLEPNGDIVASVPVIVASSVMSGVVVILIVSAIVHAISGKGKHHPRGTSHDAARSAALSLNSQVDLY